MGSVVESVSDALDDAWTSVTDEVTRWGEDISAEWKRMDPALQMGVIALATYGAGSYLSSAGYFAGGAEAAAGTAAAEGAGVAGATEAAASGMFAEGATIGELAATAAPTADAYSLAAAYEGTTATTVGADFLVEGVGAEVGAGLGGEAIAIEATGGGLTATQAGSTVATSAAGWEVPWSEVGSAALKSGLGMMGLSQGGGIQRSSKTSGISPVTAEAGTLSGAGSGLAVTEEQRKYAAPLVSGLERQQQKFSLLGGR